MSWRYDAIVIGGGPAGAATAILLAKAGWSVALVEKAEFPRRKVCGEFISATNMALLDELGVGETFRVLAGPEVRRVVLFARDAMPSSAMPRAAGGWGRALGRERLDLLLLQRAVQLGAQLWQPWSAIALEADDAGHLCRIARDRREETLGAPVVVAAHGSWERGGLPTRPRQAHRPSDLLAFKAHFRNADLPADLMPLLAFPGGYGGMVQTDAGRVSLSCCIRRDALAFCRGSRPAGSAAAAVFRHIAESCLGVRASLGCAAPEGAWLAAGPIAPGIRPRYADGIFRVGNVAGEAHPIVAEGISMAMQSAWLLAARLVAQGDRIASARDREETGRVYSHEWRKQFATRIQAAALFANLAMRPTSATLLLPLLQRFPNILTLGARLSGKAKPLGTRPVTAAGKPKPEQA